jgi:hypothetical protein
MVERNGPVKQSMTPRRVNGRREEKEKKAYRK